MMGRLATLTLGSVHAIKNPFAGAVSPMLRWQQLSKRSADWTTAKSRGPYWLDWCMRHGLEFWSPICSPKGSSASLVMS